jgi:hypothetical protein
VIEAINYAGAKGARVANISLGGEGKNPLVSAAIAANPQTLFVISAGNESKDVEQQPKWPCGVNPVGEGSGPVDNVICVAATDQADRLADFSNWGSQSVDLGAPGTETLSTFPTAVLASDDFEADDFDLKWTDSGADGGFGRTNEPPLTTYGITDSPGTAPLPNARVASTSVPVNLAAGYESCTMEVIGLREGNGLALVQISLDGTVVSGVGVSPPGRPIYLRYPLYGEQVRAGGQLTIEVSFETGDDPAAGDGSGWTTSGSAALPCRAIRPTATPSSRAPRWRPHMRPVRPRFCSHSNRPRA